MGKNISVQEVAEVRGYKLEDVLGAKGVYLATEVIRGALKDKIKIACIGRQGTGKSFLMRVILKEAKHYVPERTLDEVEEVREFTTANSDRLDFFVATAESGEDLLQKMKEITGKEVINDMLVVTREVDKNGNKYVKSIEEISSFDGVNVVTSLVVEKKGKFVKINERSVK